MDSNKTVSRLLFVTFHGFDTFRLKVNICRSQVLGNTIYRIKELCFSIATKATLQAKAW